MESFLGVSHERMQTEAEEAERAAQNESVRDSIHDCIYFKDSERLSQLLLQNPDNLHDVDEMGNGWLHLAVCRQRVSFCVQSAASLMLFDCRLIWSKFWCQREQTSTNSTQLD